jgi:UDP-glucose 4-epimerase
VSKVLVTGGAGFIGQHLTRRLSTAGYDVTVIDHTRSEFGNGNKVESKVNHLRARLSELIDNDHFKLDHFDYIYHLAGKSSVPLSVSEPWQDFEYGLQDTVRLLEELRKAKNQPVLIFPSSAAVYGEPKSLPVKESDPTVPISPYGVGKLAAENYISVFCELYGLRATIFRAFSIYGPELRKQVVFDTIQKLKKNSKQLTVHGTGAEVRDFLYIDDFIDLLLIPAAESLAPGACNIVNAASGKSVSITSLIGSIVDAMELSPEVNYTGIASSGVPKRSLGFKPKWDLKSGIERVVNWVDQLPLELPGPQIEKQSENQPAN